ncbi:MAG: glycosyltransferase family 39 protein [Bacteroidetes bacterium]|nr:glycosyltransferase family 39 protein [Bacteroidota bacterium]
MFKKVTDTIKASWNEKPLQLILLAGLFFRVLAVLFSKGFGMLDDHFLVIEQAQTWVDRVDENNWLINAKKTMEHPDGHSLFYTGLHYFLFRFLEFFGLHDAQGKMYVVRVLHAAYSMITVYYGYRITEKIAGGKVAKIAGLLLSIFWMFPFLSVRNLVEVACIPPLVLATWLSLKEEKNSFAKYFLIGLLLGISFNIRFQAILFAGGFGLALMFQRKWLAALTTALSFLICAAVIQGGSDYVIWNKPFVEFAEYVRYNIENANNYYTQPWYNYFILILGMLIPPISFFLLFGFFRNFKKNLLLFLPSFIFLAFHSYFPNKQERFILPIFPFIIILGTIGWTEFVAQSKYWRKHPSLLRNFWIFFWTLNTMALCILSLSYGKRSRVEAMCYIQSQGDASGLVIEESERNNVNISPRFYLQKWVPVFGVSKEQPLQNLEATLTLTVASLHPNYVIFYSDKNMEPRLNAMKEVFELEYKATIEPSFIDDVMFRLNPNNVNYTAFIYKVVKER